ncbi:TonB-dependent receptor [Limibacter armeniacum]|uniref:TonB-dependent receptor n=1 Tax=Limibacter armeniacum TaxID=466084 RepID=UPI002FE5D6A3
MRWIILSTVVLLCSLTQVNYAQRVAIKVIDKVTQEPLPSAHICLEDTLTHNQSYYSTSTQGKTEITWHNNMHCAISFVGYKTLWLKTKPNQTITVALEPNLFMLDQVVLTGSYTPRTKDQSIYQVNVIDNKRLELMGANTLGDALQFTSNIQMQQDPALGKSILMQGLSSQYVKILVDGIPLVGRQDGNIDLNQINIANIERIEVVEGPLSVIYGTDALAGTINIITKENKHSKLKGNISSYYESIGEWNNNLHLSTKLNKHEIGIGANHKNFAGITREGNDRSQSWKQKNQLGFQPYYKYNSHNFWVKTGVNLWHEELEALGEPVNLNTFDTLFTTQRMIAYVSSSHAIRKQSVLTSQLSYSLYNRKSNLYNWNRLNDTSKLIEDNTKHDTTTLYRYEGRVNFSHDTEKLLWQSGIEASNENGKGKRFTDTENMYEAALWSTIEWRINDKWSIQPGVRLIHHSTYSAPIIPTIHGKWKLDDRWTARLSYGRGFRAPTLKERFMEFVDSNHNIYGYKDLKAETSHSLSGQLLRRLNLSAGTGLELEAKAYFNDLNNVIELVSIGDDNTLYTYRNLLKKQTAGGNISFNFQSNQRWRWTASFNLTGRNYNDVIDQFYFGQDLTSQLSYTFKRYDMTLQADYRIFGKQNTPRVYNTEESESIEVGEREGYQILNFSINKHFLNKKVMLRTGVKNLLDITDIQNTGSSNTAHSSGSSSQPVSWGRSFFVSLKFNFQQL